MKLEEGRGKSLAPSGEGRKTHGQGGAGALGQSRGRGQSEAREQFVAFEQRLRAKLNCPFAMVKMNLL